MGEKWSKRDFSNNLKHYMVRYGKTQKEIAAIAGVSEPTISEYLACKKYPRIDKIERLADYFGIRKSDLIENKLSPQKEADNDIIADIIIRLRSDDKFLNATKELLRLDGEKLDIIISMLSAFS